MQGASDGEVLVVQPAHSGSPPVAIGSNCRALVVILPTERAPAARGWIEFVAALTVPTIAALDGDCVDDDMALAMACDLRVAHVDATLRLERRTCDGALTSRLVAVAGRARAADMMMTGAVVDAQMAMTWGLVNRVAAEGTAADSARRLGLQIAACAPLSLRISKELIDRAASTDLDEMTRLEIRAGEAIAVSRDAVEGVQAFIEGRQPRFEGR